MNLTLGIPSLMAAAAPVAAKAFSANMDRAQNVVQGNEQGLADLGTANSLINYLSGVSAQNTAKSQEFAREQMAFQRESQLASMAYNAQEAQKNRDWQELMSNTAHQREMADLQAAGLNPVLAANGGASVGSGATASSVASNGASGSVDNSSSSAVASILGSVISSMASMRNQEVSAKSALDIAEKQADTSLILGAMQADTSKYVADSSSASAKYTADSHYRGTKYSADSSLAGTMYSADSAKAATLGASANAFNAAIQAAQISSATSKAVADANNVASLERLESSQAFEYWKAFNADGRNTILNLASLIGKQLSGNYPRLIPYGADPRYAIPPSILKKYGLG